MIYLTLGHGIRQGIPLYSGIFDNKPPFLYLVAAIANNLFWFKAILAFWMIATTIIFWRLVEKLYPNNKKLVVVATCIFAVATTLPLLEGNIANAELFMIGPILLAFWIIFSRKNNFLNLFSAGLLFGLASLFKIPAAFDFPVILVFWLISQGFDKKKLLDWFKKSIFVSLGFALPILLSFGWFYLQGSFSAYLNSAFMQNLGYLSSFRPSDAQKSFIIRNLPLLIRAALVATSFVVIYIYRSRLSRNFIFLSIWLVLGLFAVTLSERPYPHYLIQVIPELAIFLAIFFAQKTKEQFLVFIPLAIAAFVPVHYHYWYYKTAPYYENFVKFATGAQTKEKYFSYFGTYTGRNYEIADFLLTSTKKSDKVFITGDSPVIYALADRLPPGKFVAEYHIKDYSSYQEETQLLTTDKPSFIILLPESSADIRPLIELIRSSYIRIANIQGAEIYRLLSFVQKP